MITLTLGEMDAWEPSWHFQNVQHPENNIEVPFVLIHVWIYDYRPIA